MIARATPIIARLDLARLVRFGAVGVSSTLLYAAIAWTLTGGARMGAATSSLLAYAAAGVFSYLAQRNFTFRSTATHREAAPRFVAVCVLGAAAAAAAPLLLTDRLGLPPLVAIGVTCVLVPLINYLVLSRLVFRGPPKPVRP